MKEDEALRERLEDVRVTAPAGLHGRIMAALPERAQGLRSFWPAAPRMWLAPALAGAAAVMMLGLFLFTLSGRNRVHIVFQLHAPSAQTVELLGSFNGWRRGNIVLTGPDASGHWTAEVDLPPGRHEYIFLVDGATLVTDPAATVVRQDGFGNRNAVMEI